MNDTSDSGLASVRAYLHDLQAILDRLEPGPIAAAIATLHRARLDGRQVFVMGNGGSASTASHMVCDLGKNTRGNGWPLFKVFCLADNMALLSALSNDYGYENAFVRQLEPVVGGGDVVVAISTSGNSPNVLRAAELAHERGAQVIALTGFDSGRLAALADVLLHVPSDSIEHVEDVHLMLQHLIVNALRGMRGSSEKLEVRSEK